MAAKSFLSKEMYSGAMTLSAEARSEVPVALLVKSTVTESSSRPEAVAMAFSVEMSHVLNAPISGSGASTIFSASLARPRRTFFELDTTDSATDAGGLLFADLDEECFVGVLGGP